MEGRDFASDAKSDKRIARVMMRMTAAINEQYLSGLEDEAYARTRVTCNTCHAGRINPQPLNAVLAQEYEVGGVDALTSEYERLRARYFGRGAYDFADALTTLATEFADRGRYGDAIRVVTLDLTHDPQSLNAHRAQVRLLIEQAIVGGERAGLRRLVDSLSTSDRPAGTMVWFTVRSVGVRLRNASRLEEAEVAFALNEELYPTDHRIITDLAQIRLSRADTVRAVTGARRALEISPDYGPARELLASLGLEAASPPKR